MIKKIEIWLKEVRAPFFTAAIVPILLGAVIAWHDTGNFNWLYFLLTLAGGILIHAGLNMINDYYDHVTGVDDINKTPTPFSGGSRMIQEGKLRPKQILMASITCFVFGGAIGIWLNSALPGNAILWVGIIGMFIAIFYSAKPIQIGYTGFGELSCFLGFGPVMTLGAYYVQNPQFSWLPVIASVPVGIMIALVLYINEFPDYEADKAKQKNTLVVKLGKAKAIKVYHVFLILTYVWIIGGAVSGIFPVYSLAVLLTLPLTVSAIKTAEVNYDKISELLPANAATIKLHLSIGILLILSFVADKLI